MTQCNICKEEKCLDDFVKRNNRSSGRQPYCKKCHNKKIREKYSTKIMREYDLNRSYGISLKEYEEMFETQNGCCKICKTHISSINHKKKKHLCVDHCHETNKIRGLLCDSCNRGLGLFKDSEDVLTSALNYLKEFKSSNVILLG